MTQVKRADRTKAIPWRYKTTEYPKTLSEFFDYDMQGVDLLKRIPREPEEQHNWFLEFYKANPDDRTLGGCCANYYVRRELHRAGKPSDDEAVREARKTYRRHAHRYDAWKAAHRIFHWDERIRMLQEANLERYNANIEQSNTENNQRLVSMAHGAFRATEDIIQRFQGESAQIYQQLKPHQKIKFIKELVEILDKIDVVKRRNLGEPTSVVALDLSVTNAIKSVLDANLIQVEESIDQLE